MNSITEIQNPFIRSSTAERDTKMNLVFFAHPMFLEHQSMPRFARMLAEGMQQRGHSVQLWAPEARFFNLPSPQALKKWLGYIDQFAVFPGTVKKRVKTCPDDTLFIFTDHTLGPWVPIVADRPNVIHSHDFMAQQSAAGEIEENHTKWTGRKYQQYIRNGYSKGKNFIPISKKTRDDLLKFLPDKPQISDLVYNGLNQSFVPKDPIEARITLGHKTGIDLREGFLLHVGGNAWYKNRLGVIELYNAWRDQSSSKLPLLLIGQKPDKATRDLFNRSAYNVDIHFLTDIEDEFLRIAYNGATVFLFPSLAEGFGWPIAEAMASGCPVLTTNEAPMTEVAGEAGFLIPRRPFGESREWAKTGACTIEEIVQLDENQRQLAITAGLENVLRFDPNLVLDRIENIYKKILKNFKPA